MATDIMQLVNATQKRQDELPDFQPGDTVNVHVRVVEGDKERIQQYQGVVIAFKGSGSNRTFTVRKVSGNVGVERIFPINSPKIAKIERLRQGRVRRAKLYFPACTSRQGGPYQREDVRREPRLIRPVRPAILAARVLTRAAFCSTAHGSK
jgi:large subunit ribosomal protein L19